ncbi:hypothetical protein ES695_07780 [Candidatus Atribacteria bacterium 1244-E10-H5-B2]|nr:MAG: hypothetical protein ES695_07780 [Candidatus Atribacteria bacterium 1244-E10-H5-B2]
MTKFRGPGNTWRKEKDRLRLDCWWEGADLDSKQLMFEGYENNRDTEDVPKGELKSEKFLDNWWNDLELGSRIKTEGKKFIYWWVMLGVEGEERTLILKNTQECLNEKLALLGKP